MKDMENMKAFKKRFKKHEGQYPFPFMSFVIFMVEMEPLPALRAKGPAISQPKVTLGI